MRTHSTVKKNFMLFVVLNLFLFGHIFAQGNFQGSNVPLTIPSVQGIKDSMTISQEKLSSDLLQLTDQRFLPAGTNLQSYAETMKNMNQFRSNGTGTLNAEAIRAGEVYIYIYLQPDVSAEILNPLVTTITDTDESNHMVVAWVKVKNIENIASLEGVKSIQSVMPPIHNTGSVTTEGDVIHKTDSVRNIYGYAGAGIKVGIISDGVTTRASAQASGDLPADGAGLTVQSNTVGGNEGTAMLEIVHDMVPSSELYFHDCGANTTAFNNGIDALVTAGCKVICDDIGWITEPFFEDGLVATHVASVLSANNIIYVSSAGNAGDSHYQGNFFPIPSSTQHDFSGIDSYPYLYLQIPNGGTGRIVLQWNDKFGSSGNDYDLYLYSYALGGVVANSLTRQTGTGSNPLEWISYTANASSAGDFAIIVNKYSGSAKTLEVYIYAGNGTGVYTDNITPVDAIFGHPAVVGAIAVGAVDVTTPNTIEYFSSQGPCTITYPSSTVRSKPDVVGVDGGVITGAGSFGSWDGVNWRFYGTSAAAPHVAAVAAQMWSAYPGKTGNEVRDAIKSSAVDLGAAGFDYIYGNGRADAKLGYLTLPVELVSFAATVESMNAILRWSTATETNNYGFEIERRKIGDMNFASMNNGNALTALQWSKASFVSGSGTSNSPKEYSFTDKDLRPGRYAYRLKQIDQDGVFKYSESVEVEVGLVPKVLTLSQNYPNPFNPMTTIEFTLAEDSKVSLKVFDMLGREVTTLMSGELKAGVLHQQTFDVSKLSSGMYIYRLQTGNMSLVKKMMVLK